MKIKISRDILAQALSEVSTFVNPKAPILILKNIKITTKNNRVKFEASDSQSIIRKYVTAEEIDQDGEFLVDTDFSKYIQKVTGNAVEIEVNDNELTVKHPKGKAEFSTISPTEYPKFDMLTEGVTEITLPASLLCDCINNAKSFIGDDDLRPTMKNIYAYVKDGEFGYCATDTRRMIVDHTPISVAANTDVHWYIDPCAFSPIVKGCKGVETLTVRITPNAVQYRIGDTIIQTAQTKGNYPDFNRVIPKTWSMECAVDKSELTETLNRVSIFANTSRLVKLNISRIDMTVTCDNIDTMRRSSEVLQHKGCNGDITIGFNTDYLISSLSVCKSDEILFRLSDSSRPLLIYQEDRPSMTILQMPMNIAN